MFTLFIDDSCQYTIISLVEGVQGPAQTELTRLQIGDRLPQYLLDQWLSNLPMHNPDPTRSQATDEGARRSPSESLGGCGLE